MESAPSGDAEPWRFGIEPLDQTLELAALMRRLAGLAVSLEHPAPAVDRLIAELRVAEQTLSGVAPPDPSPRIGSQATSDGRVYLDHSGGIGSYNPCFPEYMIDVRGDTASGAVTFPLAYEGPPGVVHGGFVALLFDCVIQDHNCQVGQAGKTVSLAVSYHRPTPLLTPLQFDVARAVVDRRITSSARLMLDGVTLCSATVEAVAGRRSGLPEVSARRTSP